MNSFKYQCLSIAPTSSDLKSEILTQTQILNFFPTLPNLPAQTQLKVIKIIMDLLLPAYPKPRIPREDELNDSYKFDNKESSCMTAETLYTSLIEVTNEKLHSSIDI